MKLIKTFLMFSLISQNTAEKISICYEIGESYGDVNLDLAAAAKFKNMRKKMLQESEDIENALNEHENDSLKNIIPESLKNIIPETIRQKSEYVAFITRLKKALRLGNMPQGDVAPSQDEYDCVNNFLEKIKSPNQRKMLQKAMENLQKEKDLVRY